MRKTIVRNMAVLALMAGSVGTASAVSFDESFSFNTRWISGTEGYLVFKLNQDGSSTTNAAAATIAFDDGGGLLGDSIERIGMVCGGLGEKLYAFSSPVSTKNEYIRQFTYGESISFRVLISGETGNVYSFAMYDANKKPLMSTSSTGEALKLTLKDNAVTVATSATPLPAAAVLFGSGLVGLIGMRRKMKS